MRHILVALIVGAALGLSTSAALAYGDNVDYPGVGLHQDEIAPAIVFQSEPASLSVAGSEQGANLWLQEMCGENIVP
jgi:hypothetical protein